MTMRRIVLLLTLASMTLALASCAGRKKIASDARTTPVSSSISETTPSPAADGAVSSLALPVLGPVRFDYDRYNLRQDALEILSRHAKILSERPELTVRIEGHCDERGTVEYNLALGERRAQAVLDYLVAYGIDRKRLTSISFGEERPVDRASSEGAWALNRRAEFVLAGAL